MDTISFISSLRQQALLLGDYNAYRQMCSRRLAKLRKKLGRVNDLRKKDQKPAPVTAEDVMKDPLYTRLLIYPSERAWAHAMHMKSFTADSPDTVSPELRGHIRSRLAKAASYAKQIRQLYSTPGSNASDVDIIEAAAYATSLLGALAFEKGHWDDALREFAVSRVCYDALLVSGGKNGEVYKEFLTSTVEPSIRYSAYQNGISRTVDIGVLARQFFPKEAEKELVEGLKRVHSGVFGEAATGEAMEGVEQALLVTEVDWRGRRAPVEEADIAVALGVAKKAEEELGRVLDGKKAGSGSGGKRTAEDFDGVLAAWQECVDETKKAIDKAHGEGVSGADPRLQNLQLIYTYVNYGLIGWRVGRNRIMAEEIEKGLREAEEVQGGKVKELVVLYDAILQSLDQIVELPGVAADEDFFQEIEAKRGLFAALRCSAIAPSHLATNTRNTLALYHRALTHITTSLPRLPSSSSTTKLDISTTDAQSLKSHLQALVTRYIALIQLQDYIQKTQRDSPAIHAPLIDTLGTYNEKIVFENLVPVNNGVEPVPVKPVFFDIAWNFVGYPVKGEEKKVEVQKKKEERAQTKKVGFLGGLFGR
ncbi:hypothetical protein L211DRAFT_636735 [Terfezia boudieri ATCC MYA-4762]|uniref:Signal recognition particle subunit SRP68 n=1 Tax=Terfezia boudieri ATCC MYA-4762 TaxID=1051890 RepID=A0A3N4LN98_9PEZI|nr:hypothetical protein L211DRAFT_636735 [Terfezia boudieri ATCC MYA-4762]